MDKEGRVVVGRAFGPGRVEPDVLELAIDVPGPQEGLEFRTPRRHRGAKDELPILVGVQPLDVVRAVDNDYLALTRGRGRRASAATGVDDQPSIDVARGATETGDTIPGGDSSPDDLAAHACIDGDACARAIRRYARRAGRRTGAHVCGACGYTCPRASR